MCDPLAIIFYTSDKNICQFFRKTAKSIAMAPGRPRADQEFRDAVCKEIREAILAKGLKQVEAAKKLGVTRQSINLYWNNRVTPSPEVICRACKSLGIKTIWYRGQNIVKYFREEKKPQSVPLQRQLFDALKQQNFTVNVAEGEDDALELRIQIRAVR